MGDAKPDRDALADDLPSVSVIIAAYNVSAWIERSVQSALNQSGVDVEVLIADDASTDDTFQIAATLSARDPRVRALQCDVNGGPGAARNAALNEARGQWVAILDADDCFAEGRLAALCDEGRAQGADIVFDDILTRDEHDVDLRGTTFSDRRGGGRLTLSDWIALNQVGHGEFSFGYAKPLIRRSFIDANMLCYDQGLRNGEDFHLILEAMMSGAAVYFTGVPGYFYTRRSGSVSRRAQDAHLRALSAADRRVTARLMDMQAHEAAALMMSRRRNLECLATSERVFSAIKAAEGTKILRELVQNPRATPRIFSHAYEAVNKRLPRWM